MNWQRAIARIAADVEDRVGRARTRISRRVIGPRSARVVPYRGYGTPERVRVRGRVLFGAEPTAATPEDRWWVNLVNTYRRLESDELPGARIRVRFQGTEHETVARPDGHFDVEIEPLVPPPVGRFWQEAAVDLIEPAGDTAIATLSVPRRPRFGVISDLDDTVLRTGATSMVRVAREVLFGNVHTRMPFPGVGAFYRALHHDPDGTRNPLFYVSSSPWSLYDVLSEFLRLHRIPAGPMELRDWGFGRAELLPVGHRQHKREAIDRIMGTYHDLPFILVGDSGQEDPEIYRGVAQDYPDRVLAIYIRNVSRDPGRAHAVEALAEGLRQEAGDPPELVLVQDTVAAAEHAAGRGWIEPSSLDSVRKLRASEQ